MRPRCSCGTPLSLPPCEYLSDGVNSFVGLRLLETWIKLMLLPILVIMGSKLLSLAFLGLEDAFATWQVRRQARKLLEEAKEKEEEARIAAGGEPTSPPRNAPSSRASRMQSPPHLISLHARPLQVSQSRPRGAASSRASRPRAKRAATAARQSRAAS